MSIQERLRMFDPKYNQSNKKPEEPKKNKNISSKPKSIINQRPNINSKKLLPKSKFISSNNGLLIYQYPLIELSELEKFHCKSIFIFGKDQKSFIENFINYCSDISFEDKIRYQSQSLKENNLQPFSIYNIKRKECIRIICFPEFNLKHDIYKDQKTFISLLKIINNITSQINYILFICNDEMEELNEYEKIALFILFNLFNKSLKDNFLFLFITKSKENNNIIDKEKILNCILNNNNESIFNNQFSFLKNCEFLFMKGKIIFDKQENYTKKDWDTLINTNNYILNKIISSNKYNIIPKKLELIEGIFLFNETKIKNIVKVLSTYIKEEQLYWCNFLIKIKKILKNDISPVLLAIYNEFYNIIGKIINIKDNNISFINIDNIDRSINLFSNINGFNLKDITFENCYLNDNHLNLLENIFGFNLISLNLSKNNISELNSFNNKIYPNLTNLDLSYNNLVDISPIFNCQISNLKKLNLSHNLINELKDIEKNNVIYIENLDISFNKLVDINNLEKTKFENMKEFYLSFNEIKDCNVFSFLSMKKINKLDLSNNRIEKIEVNKLLENVESNCSDLKLTIENDNINKYDYNLIFNYSNEKIIKFNYLIKNSELNNFFQNLSFKNIQALKLEGINYLFLLENESLKELKLLDIITPKIEDLSIFNKIHFFDIKEIKINSNIIKQGFNSLSIFPTIKTKEIEINNNDSNSFKSSIIFENPKVKINMINTNFDFLKDNIINGIETLIISNCHIDNLEFLNLPHFQNLKKFELKYNYFENKETMLIINSYLKKVNNSNNIIISTENKLNPNLIKELNEDCFHMDSIDSSNIDNLINIKYISPIKFFCLIDYNKLNDIPTFNSCKKIYINNTSLNNINFLENKNIRSLKEINLDSNQIDNIDEFNKILTNNINDELIISIRNNNISQGLYEFDNNMINNNKKIKEIQVELDKKKEKNKIILNYNKIIFDYYIDINNSLDIFKKINLENIKYLYLSHIGLKNIDFLLNDTLKNLKELNMNNNKIEDISILKKENVVFNNLEIFLLDKNLITKGFEVFQNEFFTKCLYMYIDISSFKYNKKILISFLKPKYIIEIYIGKIDDLKAIIKNYKNTTTFIPYYSFENIIENLIPPEKEIINGLIINKPRIEIDNDVIYINIMEHYDYTSKKYNYFSTTGEKSHIIIDNGTKYTKAGFSNQEGPTIVYPSCVGYPSCPRGMTLTSISAHYKWREKQFYVGEESEGSLKLNYPIEKGLVNNWDDLEKIWGDIFTHQLKIPPEEHNVMLSEVFMNPKENREKMAQIIFETFNTHGLYIAIQPVLSLYSIGKLNGLVSDSGEGITQIVPVFDGFSLPHAINKIDLAGKDLTNYILEKVIQRNSNSRRKKYSEIIKEKACYVALDLEEELKSVEGYPYELPDGREIYIKDERILCPEALFKPSIIGKGGIGIGESCCDSIQKCDIDIRKELYNCICLSGGNSMFKGFPERLKKEIKAFAHESMKEEIRIFSPSERKFSVWIGGAVLSSISTFESMWVTKAEYEESGNFIVHRKFF